VQLAASQEGLSSMQLIIAGDYAQMYTVNRKYCYCEEYFLLGCDAM
jgi:hypothetical protein